MKLRNIALLVLVLLAFTSPSWAIGIAGIAGGKRVTVSVDGTWQGTYAAGTTYVLGDIVTDGTTNYRSLQNANTGHTPASSPLYWQAILAKGDTGPTGATGPQGPTGAAGVNGKTVLTTSGAPASGTGVNGDYAYNPATYTMYGPKASGAWPAGTVIKGADGAGFTGGSDGTYGWLTDSNTSTYTECASGKYGLNFVGGVLYQCSNGTNSVFASGGGTWGSITGTLADQTDLQAALDAISAGGITISAGTPTTAGAAYLNDSTHILTVASTSGYTQFTGSFTAWDTTPDAFAFTDETDVAADGGQSCGAAITVGGTNYPTTISAAGDVGYGYKINGGTFTNAAGTVVLNDSVVPCVNRSSSNSTATTATITIGGMSDTYSVTTAVTGQSSFVTDSFTGTAATDLTTHIGESGTWSEHPSYSSGSIKISTSGRARPTTSNTSVYYHSVTPSGANYMLTGDMYVASVVNAANDGVANLTARMSTTADTMYFAGYTAISSNYYWRIGKMVNGAATVLGTYAQSLTQGSTYQIKFTLNGSSLALDIDGVNRISVTDSSITDAGMVGIKIGDGNAGSDTTGYHVDNFEATAL